MTADQSALVSALVHQVMKAVRVIGGHATERDVLTTISRPMWQRFCAALKEPENAEPTAWLGSPDTLRVYGSETVIVEDDREWAVSRPIGLSDLKSL